MQSFISRCFAAPGYLELLPQHLEAPLHPFRPWFIQPLHKLALITLLLGQAEQDISMTATTVICTARIKRQVFGILPLGNPRSACQCSSPPLAFLHDNVTTMLTLPNPNDVHSNPIMLIDSIRDGGVAVAL